MSSGPENNYLNNQVKLTSLRLLNINFYPQNSKCSFYRATLGLIFKTSGKVQSQDLFKLIKVV